MAELKYKADGEVCAAFMRSDRFVRGLRGPVGSGKSVACCIELLRRALAQACSPDGTRKTRWAVIRNTQPELRTTTIKTWLDWLPERLWGKFNWAPPFTHRMRRGEIDCEVIFLALDKPEDVKKLLSLELTGAWINEAREIPKPVIDAVTQRVGRFPSLREGGPTWSGVIMDTNAPDEDHWWPVMAGEVPPPEWLTRDEADALVRPVNWEFFTQPPAMLAVRDREGRVSRYDMNPGRENKTGIRDQYYQQMIEGKSPGWISVYVLNRYGTLQEGKPVYPEFDRSLHVSRDALLPAPNIPIHVGLDFGLTPAATFAQLLRGRWAVLGELVAADMGILRFADLLRQEMARWSQHKFVIFGDPAGDHRVQTDERTPFTILRSLGIMARPAPSNDPALRLEAVRAPLTRLVDRQPGMVIDPRCLNLIKGFETGYHYQRVNVSGAERYTEKPEKNRFSHVHDALQYMVLGGGEGRAILGQKPQAVRVVPHTWDVFARQRPKGTRRRFG